jgi:hypothetical protein
MANQQLLDELLDIERARWQSLCETNGGKLYGETMTDGALMLLADGAIMDSGAVIDALVQAPPSHWYGIDASPRRQHRQRHGRPCLCRHGLPRRLRRTVRRCEVVGVSPHR